MEIVRDPQTRTGSDAVDVRASAQPTDRLEVSRKGPPVVSLKGLSKHYGENVVLDKVDLDVSAGEVVAMVGPSGAGKSTLLRCINLLEVPDAGTVTVGDQCVDAGKEVSAKDAMRLRRTAGMVFQSFNLFPHLTVLRNVSLAQERVLGRSRAEADARSMELLERVHLAHKADTYPARSSGGQQQRIAIARALAMDPQVMLFDEPTSALDPEVGLEVLAVMRELAESGMTMIVVTHEIPFARDVSDRVVVMADGGIIEQGEPHQVINNPQHERSQRFLRAVTER
ncbi:amino acid ABC transporter ATP-binding protein, PAAT family [Quadrisphaera granulorum]|uniref:ABC-type polar-amino-acid transporter n=1 Tax=Quadrisphaera granulorum TaxID=317664 RepID=A0A316AA40_9ACTN|nr:amino acid ABC transporter ATP-binding protein (PAAT family) [Quadrisphaera granulorum]SZE96627.1 amino acid ABC transporter ATP-binding protein, PAAT family [Quadrisphaera granulorum]